MFASTSVDSQLLYEYEIPEKLRNGAPARVGMRLLTAELELMASKLGRHDLTRMNYAATKLSIATMDGQPVKANDKAIDTFWEHAHPKVRTLLMQRYLQLSSPDAEEEKSFLESETIIPA